MNTLFDEVDLKYSGMYLSRRVTEACTGRIDCGVRTYDKANPVCYNLQE